MTCFAPAVEQRKGLSAGNRLAGMGGNAFHVSPMGGVALVLDTKGVLLATVSQRFTACFAIEGKVKAGILCVATSKELVGFTLEE
jgi:hypothetical protein